MQEKANHKNLSIEWQESCQFGSEQQEGDKRVTMARKTAVQIAQLL